MNITELVDEFLALADDALTDQAHVAAYIGCSHSKLERARWAGTGIPFYRIDRSIRYKKADVLEYVDASRRTSTASTEG